MHPTKSSWAASELWQRRLIEPQKQQWRPVHSHHLEQRGVAYCKGLQGQWLAWLPEALRLELL